MLGRHLPRLALAASLLATALGVVSPAAAQDRLEGQGLSATFKVDGMPEGAMLLTEGGLFVRFRIPGVADSGEGTPGAGTKATAMHCTNFGVGVASVEWQVLNWNGDLYVGAGQVDAQGTITASTHNTSAYFEDVIVGGVGGTPAINQGSARILTDNTNLLCTAQIVDPSNIRPVYVSSLEVY